MADESVILNRSNPQELQSLVDSSSPTNAAPQPFPEVWDLMHPEDLISLRPLKDLVLKLLWEEQFPHQLQLPKNLVTYQHLVP